MPQPMTLDGPRLRLRPWQDDDLPTLARMHADPWMMRFLPKRLTREESDAWAARMQAHIDEHGWGFWVMELHDEPGLVGVCGLFNVRFEAPFTPAVEIGWRVAPGWQRQGFAYEAACLALAAGFGPLGLERIVAFTVEANQPSWRLMEKLGMRREGVFEHPSLPEGHKLRPHLLYGLDHADWVAQRMGG